MPIYIPGKRTRGLRPFFADKKDLVQDEMSLTPMIDLFVVLATFLLQQYLITGDAIPFEQQVALPQATRVKEIKPSILVVISPEVILVGDKVIGKTKNLKQSRWLLTPLHQALLQEVRGLNQQSKSIKNVDVSSVRVTIQADKKISFLDLKKVMYTITEAGISEMNFAVLRKPNEYNFKENL